MGKFSSGAVSMTRFRIAESVTRELLNEVPQRLKQFAFLPIDDIAEERGWGWANIDDMLDTEWRLLHRKKENSSRSHSGLIGGGFPRQS